jgi:thioredoxin reductase (NADPH)
VEFCWNSTISRLISEGKLTGVELTDTLTGATRELELDGLFISIGRAPATEIFREQLALDPGGYIIADETTRTSLPGVFAAGDVRTKALRQIITAAADGAVAAFYTEEYLIKE